jgi:DNA polymerase-4
MDILRSYTPLFQQVSIDEAFLDVSDLPNHAGAIAERFRSVWIARCIFPASLGVATYKLVAKVPMILAKASEKRSKHRVK